MTIEELDKLSACAVGTMGHDGFEIELRKAYSSLRDVAMAAKEWLREDDEWEAKMPDDWCTTKAAYRAREALRLSLRKLGLCE